MTKPLARTWGRSTRSKPIKVVSNWPLEDQLIGIEVELERRDNPEAIHPNADNISAYWSVKQDGSLRDGLEYVLSVPLSGNQLSSAIHNLLTYGGGVFRRNPRGSTHIHVDMMEEETTTDVLQCLAAIVYLYEGVIFKLADPSREWCGYANKLNTAPEALFEAITNPGLADNDAELKRVTRDSSIGRYYGLNMQALSKYGSVEFRYFPTAESADELTDWVCLVQSFKKAALEIGSLAKFRDVVGDDGNYEFFIRNYFGKWAEAFFGHITRQDAEKEFAYISSTYHVGEAKKKNAARRFKWHVIASDKLQINKLLKNPLAVSAEYNIICTRAGGAKIPEVEDTSPTTMLIIGRDWYLNGGRRWDYAEWRDFYDLQMLIKRLDLDPVKMLECMQKQLAITTDVYNQECIKGAIKALTQTIDYFDAVEKERVEREARAAQMITPMPPRVTTTTLGYGRPLQQREPAMDAAVAEVLRDSAFVTWNVLSEPTSTDSPTADPEDFN